MRNYITLNGKNSNEINGLLIQELPPISKPQIRTEVEEIDGRDGDIVTKLGFAAYDKEFTVGLYKDFDINEIIAYFNSEGTVVFSNESDKYYNYQIIDQIDFERLVRYRTATVRMHCQPFKYSNTEGARTLGNKGTASGEGSFITLDNTPEAQFSKIEPKGNAEQTTLPSDYQAVEYIEANATQYIDTGVQLGANDFTIETGVTPTADASYEQPFLSICTSAYGYWNWFKTSQNLDCYTSGHHVINGGATTGTYYDLKLSRVGNTWNQSSNSASDSWTFSPSSVNNTTLKLFNRGDLNGKTNAQLYYLRIFVAGELVRNYVPCYRISDSVIGLYDLVNDTFYANAGTGESSKGSDTASPSPSCPQDVQVVTGENTVKITGKNLLKTDRTLGTPSNTAWGNSTKRLFDFDEYVVGITRNNYYSGASTTTAVVDGSAYTITTIQGGYGVGLPIELLPNTEYVVSADITNQANAEICVGFYQDDGTYIGMEEPLRGNRTFTFTTPSNCAFADIILACATNQTCTFSNIQLELGSTATAYEPYQGQEFPIDLGSIELAKIGDYQDRIYKSDSKWYIRRAVRHLSLPVASMNDSDSYPGWSNVEHIRADLGTSLNTPLQSVTSRMVNIEDGTKYFGINTNGSGATLFTSNSASGIFGTKTATAIKADYPNLVVELYYGILEANQYDEEITNEALIAQLEALYNQAHAYKGRTHVAAIAQGSNAPHIIEAEVQRSSDGNITNNGNIVSKPTLTIYGSGNIGVSLNGYQIFEITLGDEEYITIDTAAMEAYKDTLDNLKNRLVNGDYSKFALRPGSNMIEFSGIVSKCVISKYSRWL